MQLAFVECRDQQIASNSGFGKIGFLDKFSEILRIAKFKFVCGWEFCECQPQTKHVEKLLFHFSDVGSTPTASTKKTRLGLFLWRGSCCAPAQANFVCNPRDVAGARRCLLVSGVKLSLDCISHRFHQKDPLGSFFVAWELLCSCTSKLRLQPTWRGWRPSLLARQRSQVLTWLHLTSLHKRTNQCLFAEMKIVMLLIRQLMVVFCVKYLFFSYYVLDKTFQKGDFLWHVVEEDVVDKQIKQ